ncbi:hypothetical protein [Legionella genomosp. 1]|uniref:hypothetical protein n=1 Tax=Legionella genomosp. 1 TaxID=1093625 RepID=UPI001056BD54|nr:hypothetical protein [Legionella genomosp. 1]
MKEAADKFDMWMKDYVLWRQKYARSFADDNEALMEFLTYDVGFAYVKTYAELGELAAILADDYDYATTNPPCNPMDYMWAIDKANPSSFHGNAPKPLEGDILQYAAYKFEKWNNSFPNAYRIFKKPPDNDILVNFLKSDAGFKFVKTYEDICQLADILKERGYSTTNPPCTEARFTTALNRAIEADGAINNPLSPLSMML